MRILFLCHRVPFPPNRGDRIATHRRLLHLASRHDVTCLTFAGEPTDGPSIEAIEREGVRVVADRTPEWWRRAKSIAALPTDVPLTLPCFGSKLLHREVAEIARRGIDLTVAYSSCMAQFVERLGGPKVMEFGDLDSDKWSQYADESAGPWRWIYRREARTLGAYERAMARLFDVSIVVSKAEAATFEERTGVRPEVVANGVDLERMRPGVDAERVAGRIIFTGIMDYRPNVEGCVRFAQSILPAVRTRVPHAHLQIVGARPTREIRALAGSAVEVTGPVPETADYLRKASVAIAPLRLGRGLQNKVLEAMACGTPLVASATATAGVDATAGEHFLLARDDADMAARVADLLTDVASARALAQRARRRVEERYRWEAALAAYDAALALAVERHGKR